MAVEELKVGDRVKFWWNWCQREGRVAKIHEYEHDFQTMYEVEEVPGCNRMLYREEITEVLRSTSATRSGGSEAS